MQQIATRAGVSRQTVYYHFPTKDALLIEVIARRVRALRDELHEQVAPDGIDGLINAICYSIGVLHEDKYSHLLLVPDSMNLTARLSDSDLIMGLSREWYGPYLASAEDRGELRTDLHHDDIIRWLLAVNFMLLAAGEHLGLSDEHQVRTMAEVFLRPSFLPSAELPKGRTSQGKRAPRNKGAGAPSQRSR
jgi:AcrR family transcriptional regulator